MSLKWNSKWFFIFIWNVTERDESSSLNFCAVVQVLMLEIWLIKVFYSKPLMYFQQCDLHCWFIQTSQTSQTNGSSRNTLKTHWRNSLGWFDEVSWSFIPSGVRELRGALSEGYDVCFSLWIHFENKIFLHNILTLHVNVNMSVWTSGLLIHIALFLDTPCISY